MNAAKIERNALLDSNLNGQHCIDTISGGGGYQERDKKKRITWIDIAKGIAILLVVYGHTIVYSTPQGKLPGGLIYSFHMPLFFILSAITSRYSKNMQEFKQNALKTVRHLLIPAAAIYLFFVFYVIWQNPNNFLSWQFWKEYLFAFLFYHCGFVEFEGITVPSMRTSWFFVALLVAKILFDFLQMAVPKKMQGIVVLLASCIGVAMGKQEILVFSFDAALAVLPFLYIGYHFKKIEDKNIFQLNKLWLWGVIFVIWLALALLSYKNCFNLAARRYPLFPLCYLTAILGSFLCIALAKVLEKAKIFLPLQFLGKYCIYFYMVHCIDVTYKDWYTISNSIFLNFLTRTAIDLAFFLVLVGVHIALVKIQHFRKNKKISRLASNNIEER